MRRFQFSLLGLFGLVTCAAMGSAAMVHASANWCSAVAVAVLLALLISILGVVFHRGPARAFWIGFLVFGWGSLAVLFGSLLSISSPVASPYSANSSVFLDGPLNALYEATHDARQWNPYQYYVPAPTPLPLIPATTPSSGAIQPAPSSGRITFPEPVAPGPSFGSDAPTAPPTTGLTPAAPDAVPAVPSTVAPTFIAPIAPFPIPDPYNAAYFKITGNLLFVVLLALVGGVLARGFYTTSHAIPPKDKGGHTSLADPLDQTRGAQDPS